MKTCPLCKRTYEDDHFSFCLDDGTVLSVSYDPLSTLPLPDARDTDPPRTEVLPPQWKPVPPNMPRPVTVPYPGASQTPPKQSSKHWFVITGVLGMVAAGLLIVVGYMAWKITDKPAAEPSTASVTPPSATNVPVIANNNVNAIPNKNTPAKPAEENNSLWLNGVWEGKGFQSNTKTSWTIRLTVQGGAYQIEYPSIPCGGRWILIQNTNAKARFQELITQGIARCESNTTVAIEKVDDSHLSCRYSSSRTKTVIAVATLTRNSSSSVKQ